MTVEFISQSISTEVWDQGGSYLRPLDRQSDTHTGTHSTVVKMSGSILGRTAVVKMSGSRYVSDCRSRGREFDLGPVPYFQGD